MDEILQLIVAMTASLLGSKICSVMLLDEEKRQLRIAATQSLSDAYRNKPPVPVDQSLSGRAVVEKKPIIVADVRKDKRFSYPDIAVSEGLVSLLSLPMMFKDKVLGVINTYSAQEYDFQRRYFRSAIGGQPMRLGHHANQTPAGKTFRPGSPGDPQTRGTGQGRSHEKTRLSEPEAFREIQKQSMDRRKSMKEIAEALLLAEDLGQGR
jgi:hypothetical protein